MELIIKFTNQSSSFAHGVEFGRLLQKMEDQRNHIMNEGFPIRVENREVILAACEKYGYIPIFGSEYFGEWIEFMGMKKISLNN